MLRLVRGIHTSRCLFQEVSKVEQNKQNVEGFLKYWRTSKNLRILMYRPRHAQELLSRDLLDPHTDGRARPQELPKVPSKFTVGSYIQQVSKKEDLSQLQEDLLLIGRRADCLNSYHLNELLIKYAEFKRVQNAIVFIYSNPLSQRLRDTSTLNMILLFLYLNPNKVLSNKLLKVKIAKKSMRPVQPDAITDLLECAMYVKAGKDFIPKELFQKAKDAKLSLPFETLGKSVGHQANLLNEFQHTYLFLKAISEQLSTHENFKMLSPVRYLQGFVFRYEETMKNLNKPNRYEEIKANSQFFSKIPEPVFAAHQAAKQEASA